jgi:hypothetical protein
MRTMVQSKDVRRMLNGDNYATSQLPTTQGGNFRMTGTDALGRCAVGRCVVVLPHFTIT